MFSNKQTVARKVPLLYAYAVFGLLSALAGNLLSAYALPATYNLDPRSLHELIIFSTTATAIANGAIAVYLVTSRKLRRLVIIFRMLLVLQLLGLAVLFFNIEQTQYYGVILSLMYASFTLFVLVRLSKLKASSKDAGKKNKQATAGVQSKVRRMLKGLTRAAGMTVKGALRFFVASFGLTIAGVGMVILLDGHMTMSHVLGAVLFVLGLLYVAPYYVLKRRLLVIYIGLLVLVSAAAIYCLYQPLSSAVPTPALWPYPSATTDPFFLIAWSVFHASLAFIFWNTLIAIDIVVAKLKTVSEHEATQRTALVLSLPVIILTAIILGNYVRTYKMPPPVHNAAPLSESTEEEDKGSLQSDNDYTVTLDSNGQPSEVPYDSNSTAVDEIPPEEQPYSGGDGTVGDYHPTESVELAPN